MSPILDLQIRMRELGRVRMGEKGPRGEPRKLTHFRLTSASRALLEAAAANPSIGGTVREWSGAPDEGMFELYTETDSLEIILPPVFSLADGSPSSPVSQYMEHWLSGGCQRRCDGVTELLTEQPCLCAAEGQTGRDRLCKITTRIQFMLPALPDIGVFRLDSHGFYAAVEAPGTLEILRRAAEGQEFIPATLRIEQRSRKVNNQTRRYIVPIVELRQSLLELAANEANGLPVSLNAAPRAEKPALPAAVQAPVDPTPIDAPEFPPVPDIPSVAPEDPAEASFSAPPGDGQSAGSGATVTPAQKKKLNMLVGQLRDAGHITTEQLWSAGGLDPELGRGEDGEIHWSPLRDTLTKEQASALIDRLERLHESVQVTA